MTAKIPTPDLGSLDEPSETIPRALRPVLKAPSRKIEPQIDELVKPGFVTEVAAPEQQEPIEVITIEVPQRLKRALQAEVSGRKDDPLRRNIASMKSVIVEALAAHGYGHLIEQKDIEVQAGSFMKRQSAQLRRKG